jgi:tryptophanyl-tRNA synthetase
MKKGAKNGKDFILNPWEVSGNVNYKKLMDEFGITEMKSLPEIFEKEILFRRGIIFAHRDFQNILNTIKSKKKFVMMTGLMPSGKFHFGHAVLAKQFPFYQKLGAKIYIAVADLEAHNIRKKSFEELRRVAIEEYLKNYIALGLKPKNCDFYFQSARSKDAKKSNAYYRLASNFSNYATFNEFKGVYGEVNPGKINASLFQAADMYHPQLSDFEGPETRVLIPVGIDQDPHIRIARGMARRNKDQEFIPISSTYHLFLPSLKGSGKMSSSDENSFIAMTDNEEEVERKIKRYAFSGGRESLEAHRKHGGSPEKDVSFQYLKMFFEPNDKKLDEIRSKYESGELLTSELKVITIEKINSFLKGHQKKLKLADKVVGKFLN